jgi:hypothetical protein
VLYCVVRVHQNLNDVGLGLIQYKRDGTMKATMIITALGILYRNGGRALIKKYIEDPNNDWDDNVIKCLDDFFGYKEVK